MTREEAIAILDGFKHNPLFNEQHFEALDMAISALSEKDWKFYYDHGYAQAKRELSENKGEWLDDVKAEIEHMACRQYEHRLMLDRQETLEILDKYIGKAESEEK